MDEIANVVVFGDLPIATKIIKYVKNNKKNINVYAVIGNKNPHNNDPWVDELCAYDYCNQNNIQMLTLDSLFDYKDNYFNLGLSCRYSKIIPVGIIKKFKFGIINMHGGLIPEFRGLCSVNFEIATGSKIAGGTIHYIDECIDTGNIIKRCEFNLEEDDTAFTVFQKTQLCLENELEKIIDDALYNFLPTKSIQYYVDLGYDSNYYNKKDLLKYKILNLKEMDLKKINQIVRAFDFPGYEPAYYIDDMGNKIYLTYNRY